MTTTSRLIVPFMIVLAASALTAQQTPVRDNATPWPTTGTGVISGVVINDKTGQPVRRTVVTASATDSVRAAVITDDTGTFTFKDLPPGRFYLNATRPGYVSVSYGARRANRPGSTINLTEGESKTGIALRMQPGAVITGVVRNANGEPVPGSRVIVLRSSFSYDTGERTLVPVSGGLGATTDDRGIYRAFGLPPDDYFVVASAGIGLRSGSDMREVTAQEIDWAARQLRAAGSAPSSFQVSMARILRPELRARCRFSS